MKRVSGSGAVHGGSNSGGGGAAAGGNGLSAASAPLGENAQLAYQSAQATLDAFAGDAQRYEQCLGKMLDGLRSVVNEAEVLRRHYEEVLNEKAYLEQLVAQADSRLQDVRNIVDRYANVKDAVVASDGYTYERKTITDYINECEQTGSRPKSQRVDVTLTTLLIPNRSLNTLLERLTEARRAHASASNNNSSNISSSSASSSKGASHGSHHHGSNSHHASASAATAATSGGGGGGDGSKPAAYMHDGNGNGSTNNSATAAMTAGERANGVGGGGGGSSHMGTAASRNRDVDRLVEVNEKGERVHPCLRVYGHCNYGNVCAYARYPYDACLSHLKGKCRFRSQCHERHVDYRGPLAGEMPTSSSSTASAAVLSYARNGDASMTTDKGGIA